jgi:hypothetical protein
MYTHGGVFPVLAEVSGNRLVSPAYLPQHATPSARRHEQPQPSSLIPATTPRLQMEVGSKSLLFNTQQRLQQRPQPQQRRKNQQQRKHSKREPSPSQHSITLNLAHCKYRIFHDVAYSLGWQVSLSADIVLDSKLMDVCGGGSGGGGGVWDVLWIDSGHGIDRIIRSMKTFQRINHFPGMVHLYRKDLLAETMQQMRGLVGAEEFSFTPQSWCLPRDWGLVHKYLKRRPASSASSSSLLSTSSSRNKPRIVIAKPTTGAQGRGIALAARPEQLLHCLREPHVVQAYLSRPLLVDGFKFDMRVYVLVVSVEPLRVLLFRNGLCRFCTSPYAPPAKDNLDNTFMHLTNYSINKHNDAFVQNNSNMHSHQSSTGAAEREHNEVREVFADTEGEDRETFETKEWPHRSHAANNKPSLGEHEQGSKRSFAWLHGWLFRRGLSFDIVWKEIAHVVVKTLLANLPTLQANLRNCKLDGQNINPFTCFEVSHCSIFD